MRTDEDGCANGTRIIRLFKRDFACFNSMDIEYRVFKLPKRYEYQLNSTIVTLIVITINLEI